jgi:glycosyltransferase involved in cell wall biosynthesis
MRILVAHPGTQHSARLAAELARRNALSGFYTGVAYSAHGLVDRICHVVPQAWERRLRKRRVVGVQSRLLHARPLNELAAHWRLRHGGNAQEVWQRRGERFQHSIPERALRAASAVIAFDTSAWILAERCAAHGVPLLLDQTTPHPDAKLPIYRQLRKRYPEWDDWSELRRPVVRQAEEVEHQRATLIVAGSTFVQNSLISHGVPQSRIRVNAYGVDTNEFRPNGQRADQPMRFIYAGAIRGRKGMPLLIEAWRQLRPRGAELWIVGAASSATQHLIPDLPGLRVLGAMPREQLATTLRECDVFVFPSFFEGLALVVLEALASGLPVIATTTSGAADVITAGQDGFLIDPGNVAALVELMNACLEQPAMVREMAQKARVTAERFTWSAYGDRWMQILADVC